MIELALVGIPNAGKSTFFKAVTLKNVDIADYPFTTIKPNEGVAYVTTKCVCSTFGKNCGKCIDGVRFVPVKIWDVAGLVKDAHKGRGRGNAFLDDLRQASALIHVLDISGHTDSEGNKTKNFNPLVNLKILNDEIDYWLLGIFKKDERMIEQKKSEFLSILEKRLSGLGITKDHISDALLENNLNYMDFEKWSEDEKLKFIHTMRVKAKPIYVAANKVDMPGSENNISLLENNFSLCSAEIELALREASKHELIRYIPGASEFTVNADVDEKKKNALHYMKQFLNKYKSTGVQDVLNKTVFELLDMIVVYPVADPHKLTDKNNNVLPDAFLLKRGSTVLDLAYTVHEDIGKTFITAIDAKTGRNIGADYVLKDGDVISIKAAAI